MNKEQIGINDSTITITAKRDYSARCGWSICVFTAVGSIRTMHIHDGAAFSRFIDAAAVLSGVGGIREPQERTAMVEAIHKVTDNELFAIEGIHEWHSHEH